jgi:hypothetical protein
MNVTKHETLEMFTAVKIQILVFWFMTPFNDVVGGP